MAQAPPTLTLAQVRTSGLSDQGPIRLPRQRGVCSQSLLLSLGSPCPCCFSEINKCSVERTLVARGRAGCAVREEGGAGAGGGCLAGAGSRQGPLGARTRQGDARRPRRRRDSTHPCRGAEPLQTRKTGGSWLMSHSSVKPFLTVWRSSSTSTVTERLAWPSWPERT